MPGAPDPLYVRARRALAGAGSRSADLGPHGNRVARRAKGLEGAASPRLVGFRRLRAHNGGVFPAGAVLT